MCHSMEQWNILTAVVNSEVTIINIIDYENIIVIISLNNLNGAL